MSRHQILFAAAVALAGCSGGAMSEAQLASAEQPVAPDFAAQLDGAPPVTPPAPVAPIVVQAPPPLAVEKPQPAPKPAYPVQSSAKQASSSMWCDISVRKTPNGIRITPIVQSRRSLSGEYSLVITKTGKAGSSDISQGGPFNAASGERVELGSSEFSLERGAGFRALLKVRAGGREICREVRS